MTIVEKGDLRRWVFTYRQQATTRGFDEEYTEEQRKISFRRSHYRDGKFSVHAYLDAKKRLTDVRAFVDREKNDLVVRMRSKAWDASFFEGVDTCYFQEGEALDCAVLYPQEKNSGVERLVLHYSKNKIQIYSSLDGVVKKGSVDRFDDDKVEVYSSDKVCVANLNGIFFGQRMNCLQIKEGEITTDLFFPENILPGQNDRSPVEILERRNDRGWLDLVGQMSNTFQVFKVENGAQNIPEPDSPTIHSALSGMRGSGIHLYQVSK